MSPGVSREGDAPGPRPLARYILLRLLLGLALLGLALVALLDRPSLSPDLQREFALTAGMFLVMGVSAALLPRFGHRPWFLWSQMLVDGLFAVGLVSFTGGPLSPFFPLFFVNVVAAAFLLPPRGPLLVALADTAAYGLFIAGQGAAGVQAAFDNNVLQAYSQLVLQGFAFLLVGMLSSTLSGNVRRARTALAEQAQAAAALRERHARILEEVDTGVLVTDAQGRVVDANPAARDLLVAPLGYPLVGLLEPQGRRWEEQRPLSGELRSLLCSRSPLADGGEVVVVQDVTRLRQMEAAVAREERLGAVGRLAAGLAHELRNPLASLSGSVQLLRDEGASPLHDIVLREVKRLNELVEEFLDSARPVRLDPSPTDAGALIGDVTAAFRNDARYKGRRLLRTAAQRLPLVPLDAARFRQVLWNLLLNAAQATPDYGTITVNARVDGAALEVVVEDDGVGIDMIALQRIFDPFYTTRSGGTGLGLANVERIVRAHGGTIAVTSVPGQGTRFVLRFPLEPGRGPTAEEPDHEGRRGPGPGAGR